MADLDVTRLLGLPGHTPHETVIDELRRRLAGGGPNDHVALCMLLGVRTQTTAVEVRGIIERRMEAWQTEVAEHAARVQAIEARIDEFKADDVLTTEEVRWLKTGTTA